MTTFIKDQTIYRNEIQYRIVRPVSDEVQLENTTSGELSNHKLPDLLTEYTKGILLTVPKKIHNFKQGNIVQGSPVNMAQMSEAARVETRRRIDYLTKLNDQFSFEGSRKQLCQVILEISRLRGEECAPHVTTVYRWRKRFLQARKDVCALFSRIESRGGKNQSRLDAEVEAIIHEKIETVFLANKCGSAEEVHDAVFLAIQHANTTQIEQEWLQVPSLRTIQRRIENLYGFDIAVAKYGRKEAERRYGATLASRRVTRILEIAEIDHSPVDIMVTDEERVVIGRPTITVIIDRFSRCVLGYHLSLAGHGTPAVFEALRHALLPKTYLQERYGDLGLTWDCHGWMERLLMDNGREFHAAAVVDALMGLGIITEYAASREPNDKPFVERFLKTFNYSFIHRLKGTTLARLDKRIGFKAEEDACISLKELDRMTHAWIMGVYLLRPHGGLNKRAPIDVWRQSASAHPPQLKANAEDLDIEFSEIGTSALQHYGIDLNTHRYASVRLSNLRRMLPQKNTKVDVKWPRWDAGHIYVWDAFEKEYFKVPNTDESMVGLTVEQAKAAKKHISDNPEYMRTRAKTSEVVREMGANAAADKKLKNRRKGARFDNQTSRDMHRPTSTPSLTQATGSKSVFEESGKTVEGFAIEQMDCDGGN